MRFTDINQACLAKMSGCGVQEGVIGCIMLDVVLLHLSPTGQTISAYCQAGVAGNTFGLVWSFPGAQEDGEIRLADKGPGH